METIVFPRVDKNGRVQFDGGSVVLHRTTYSQALAIAGPGRVRIPGFDEDSVSITFQTKSGWMKLDVDLIQDRVDTVCLELPRPVPVPFLMREYGLTEVGERKEIPSGAMLTWPSHGIMFILDPHNGGLVTHLAFEREEY